MSDEDEELTYAQAGVDIGESEAATDALLAAFDTFDTDEYAGVIEIDDRYIALATDGVGTKLLVAEAMGRYETIGIDCIAMNVNDLVAMGVRPLGFVDYLAIDDPDADITSAIGTGLADGAEHADIALLGGETAVLPEIVTGFDLAGACVGMATQGDLLSGDAAVGDRLVGLGSTGIHSNGLTLARQAATTEHAYTDPLPTDPERSIGAALLEPTRIYTDCLSALREYANAAAHMTGGGWTNLGRLGTHRYDIYAPFDPQPVFSFIQNAGNVSEEEMYRTYNMGTGFVAAVPAEDAETVADQTGGRVIGTVEEGNAVDVNNVTLELD